MFCVSGGEENEENPPFKITNIKKKSLLQENGCFFITCKDDGRSFTILYEEDSD